MRKGLLILAAGAAFLAGCNTEGCLDNQSALPLAEFYASASKEVISLGTLRISGVGAPGDSILAEAGTPYSRVYLPMRSAKTSTAWCFEYTQPGLDLPELNDTIKFDYTSTPFFASEECGAMYFYHIDKCRYTTHLIDSVVVADSLITNTDMVRIRIYFRTDNEQQEPQS